MKSLRCFATFLALSLVAASNVLAKDAASIRISLAGDSTVSTWAPNNPKKGWGQFLGECFDAGVSIDNFAKSGRSTKTFLNEGLWAQVLKSHADYILIQFGHNDSHAPSRPEHTDPNGLYTELLTRFVKEAREAGAVPILVTPVQRRTNTDTLLPYVAAMKKVAEETHTTLIDLHATSGELYERLGTDAQAKIGATPKDTTHFNATGAKLIAGLVAEELASKVPALRAHLASAAR